MIDKRIGMRFKECRELKGYTQEQFAEKTGLSVGYISSIERGKAFPRYDKLILILNTLEVSSDSIFCDVVPYTSSSSKNQISERIEALPAESQSRIYEILNLLIKQENERK